MTTTSSNTLLTTAFAASKAVPPSSLGNASRCGPSSLLLKSTSTTATWRESSQQRHRNNDTAADVTGQQQQHPAPLTQAEATTLNLFLRSSRSTAPLQIADIQGVIDAQTGDRSTPAVRKGRIRTEGPPGSSGSGIQCCVVDCYPFDRCEVVATVVKKNAVYRQQARVHDNQKGKGKAANDDVDDASGVREEIQLIFYDLDDDSGASITCCVNPAKVYAKELADSRRRQQASQARDSEDYSSTTDTESIDENPSHPQAGSEHPDNCPQSDRTPTKQARSDPRLWMYRYKSPPRPPTATTKLSKPSPSSPSFSIPLYEEGTVLRITGKIFINPARGNERQLEASSVECVYEPEHRVGRRTVKEKGNKYAEWHHTVKCRKKRLEWKDRQKVRELIGFEAAPVGQERHSGLYSGDTVNQSSVANDSTMLDVTMPPANDTLDTTCLSSTSLLDASRLPSNNTTMTTISASTSLQASATTAAKRKRAKLPSCSTLYKQKIQITKEIFALYVHQYFRDLEKGRHGRYGTMLPIAGDNAAMNVEKASMESLKEDKNLKWLAEIYARSEARRLATIKAEAEAESGTCSASTPKAKSRHTSLADSSVIRPSSPSPCRHTVRATPRHAPIAMSDTTNQLSSVSSSSALDSKKKIKLSHDVVDKIRNELFRNTILKLVKDGIIVVYPPELSHRSSSSSSSSSTRSKNPQDCETCSRMHKLEVERLPPLMTMDGIPLREYAASTMQQGRTCQCTEAAAESPASRSSSQEETYALLTAAMLLPVVEKAVLRFEGGGNGDLEKVWNAVRRTDDMWRFASKEAVKECLEMI